jgi:glycosyltransferase involved in cell wall biosynthesis
MQANGPESDLPPGSQNTPFRPRRHLTPDLKVSVIIPCYNEEEMLPLLFKNLNAGAAQWGLDYEVILVDDGSTDGTWEAMYQLNQLDPRWKMLSLSRNFGHQIALWTGLCAAGGSVVAVLDADLQDPPEILPAFFKKWEEGYDVIYGVRTKRKEGIFKRASYYLFYRLLSMVSDVRIPLDTGDFCVMDQRVVRVIARSPERRPFIRGLRAWAGFKQLALPYERRSRAAGEPKYTLVKLLKLAFDGILSSSIKPLRFASYMGMIVSTLAFAGSIFTLLQRIFADRFASVGLKPVPGFATIVIALLFLGGVQLLCLGIVGEYLGRVYESVRGRPTAVIADSFGVADPFEPTGQSLPTVAQRGGV